MRWVLAIVGFLLTFLFGTMFVGMRHSPKPVPVSLTSEKKSEDAKLTSTQERVPTVYPVPETSMGGVLNEKAKYLPEPVYPPAARAVRAAGNVAVQVLVSKEGQVISASAVSGHPLLRAAAEDAARKAVFDPIMLYGTPVTTSGVLFYQFPK